ncbi:MAG: hypothetical protein UW09_C0004G0103 [candidate division TM6 bacterium GW2011_GWF2_43_87]|nr:MAG: hypothetical protein UW09_C0004G0103 [candidate division TM6 bacterium GW2011_GWF2_43_87]
MKEISSTMVWVAGFFLVASLALSPIFFIETIMETSAQAAAETPFNNYNTLSGVG